MADGTNREFKGHRWHAALYDRLTKGDEKWISRYGSHITAEAEGRVLEIGAGTGHSFARYAKAREVVATEPDPFMLARARERLETLGLSHIELCQHVAEALPFENDSFDHVVSIVVLCTVQDPARALSEVKRVLKPGGTLRFVEHVRHERGLRGFVQDAIAPVWSYLDGGCHVNRRTAETIVGVGFQFVDLQRYVTGLGIPILVGVARPI